MIIVRPPLRSIFFVAVVVAMVSVIFWTTIEGLVTRFDTYRPIGVVAAIAAAIVWLRRHELSTFAVVPYWPGLFPLAGAGLVWLIGEMLLVRFLTDISVVAMVSMCVLTLLGYQWTRALFFSLAFLLFAIPIGGPIVPTLVNWTAKISVLALQTSGIPIHKEGAYFMIPSGNWSIAEACSGIGYFSTCLMLGCLYSWALYQSIAKRIVFFVGAAIIGVIGNWIRVYLTVLIAHLTDNRLLRDDHSAFGWAVFAALLITYGVIGLRFRDNLAWAGAETRSRESSRQHGKSENLQSSRTQVASASIAVIAVMAVWPILNYQLSTRGGVSEIAVSDIAAERGWKKVDNVNSIWSPELQNPSTTRVQFFEKGGRHVGVFIGLFQRQTWNSKLVTSVNQLASEDNPDWKLLAEVADRANYSGKSIDVISGTLSGYQGKIIAWRWYWIDGNVTTSGASAKLDQLLLRLHGKNDISAWVAIFSREEEGTDSTVKVLHEFTQDMGYALERALRRSAS